MDAIKMLGGLITSEQKKKMAIDWLKKSSLKHAEEQKTLNSKIHYLISFHSDGEHKGEPYFTLFIGNEKIRNISFEEIL